MKTKFYSESDQFAKVVSHQKSFGKAVRAGSVSEADAKQRLKQYEKLFNNYVNLKESMRAFSSYVESPILANQYFNASVIGLAQSFSGFLTIERAMDTPNMLLHYLDLIGATDNRTVLPNVGVEDTTGMNNSITWDNTFTVGQTSYTVLATRKLIPGTVKITMTHAAGGSIEITDDGEGNLVGPATALAAGSITYTTGVIAFTTGAGFVIAAGDTYSVSAVADQAGISNVNRFKTELKNILINTYPELLIGESNLASVAAMQKSLGIDPNEVLISKLTELYTKIINQRIVEEVVSAHAGNSRQIDLDPTAFDNYNSTIDKFQSQLTDVDSDMARKSSKGVRATAYVVGTTVGSFFRKTRMRGLFKDTPSSYVNDLIGYFEGVPVMEHVDLPSNEGYAIHKTADGNLAPVCRGMFLPLTNTPSVGNYENPTQLANGVFYQENSKAIAPELIQKFEITNSGV